MLKTFNHEQETNARSVYDYYRDVKGITPESTVEKRWFQSEILKHLYPGVSYLIVLPTGEGKTLIADLLTSTYLSKKKKVLFCVPFLALMNEQYKDSLKKWPESSNIRIKRFIKGAFGCSIERPNLIFSTYERAQGVLQRLLNAKMLAPKRSPFSKIGLIVMDEIHTISDENRGKVVEWLIMMAKVNGIPILGLTGTLDLKGAIELGNYMGSTVIYSNVRSVPLPIRFYFSSIEPLKVPLNRDEHYFKLISLIKNGENYYNETNGIPMDLNNSLLEDFDILEEFFRDYPDKVSEFQKLESIKFDNPEKKLRFQVPQKKYLLMAMIANYLNESDMIGDKRNGVLIYVPTKSEITRLLQPENKNSVRMSLPLIELNRDAIAYRDKRLALLKSHDNKISPINNELIPLGYAIHTGDITNNEERDLIIDLYEHHSIRILFATSTLSAGVNLSNLSLVVITGTWRFTHKIQMNEIIQTAGRAGRSPGYPGEAWIFYDLQDDLTSINPQLKLSKLIATEEDLEVDVKNPLDIKELTRNEKREFKRSQFLLSKEWPEYELSSQTKEKIKWVDNYFKEKDRKKKAPYEVCQRYRSEIFEEFLNNMILKKGINFIKSIICDKCAFPITNDLNNCLKVMCQLMGLYKETFDEAYNSFIKWEVNKEVVFLKMKGKGLINEGGFVTCLGGDVGILNMDIDYVKKIQTTFKSILLKINEIQSENPSDLSKFLEVIIIWMIISCSDYNSLEGPVKSIENVLITKNPSHEGGAIAIYEDVEVLNQNGPFKKFLHDLLYLDIDEKKLTENNYKVDNPALVRAVSFSIIWIRLYNPGGSYGGYPLKLISTPIDDITAAFIDGLRILLEYLNLSTSFDEFKPQLRTPFSQDLMTQLITVCEQERASLKLKLDPYNIILYENLQTLKKGRFTGERLMEICNSLRRRWKEIYKPNYNKEKDIYYLATLIWDTLNNDLPLIKILSSIQLKQEEADFLRMMFEERITIEPSLDEEDLLIQEYLKIRMNNQKEE